MDTPPPLTYNVSTLTIQQYFGYSPSLALAWTAAGLYLAAAVVLSVLILTFRNKNARYVWLLVFTALAECGGYVALIWMIYASGTTSIYSAYVAFQCLVVLSPNLLQAVVYRTVGQVARVGNLSQRGGCLKASFISVFFIILDVACLIIQAVGISIWASEKSSGQPNVDTVKLGSYITVVGLGLQLVSFSIFIILARYIQRHAENGFRRHKEHGLLYSGVYLSILLVSIRNIYRFVEFLDGAIVYPSASGIAENQALFYGLETLPVLLAFASLIIFSPTYLLPKVKPLESYLESPFDMDDLESGSESIKQVDVADSVERQAAKAPGLTDKDDRLVTVEI